ncbi:hypothetical protein QCA50_014068 [Cerrena zonata]|uniref:Uncharacterized protein n=1 Tax=Cerrena zonata TaxID=2478898 RepID=A0AAW0FV05_9APHY
MDVDFDPPFPSEPDITPDAIVPSTSIEPPTLGRGQRKKRPTWKVIEQHHSSAAISVAPTVTEPLPPQAPMPQFDTHAGRVDHYGLYAKYLSPIPTTSPTYFTPTPIHFIEPASRVPERLRRRALPPSPTDGTSLKLNLSPTHAFSSPSAELIMNWHWSSKTKSLEDTNLLVHSVFRHIKADELVNFDARRETRLFDMSISDLKDGWREISVKIQVPDGKPHPLDGSSPIPVFTVDGLVYRSITEVIKQVWSSPESAEFQYVPFRQFWTHGTSEEHDRVYGELFTSEAFNEVYEELQSLPPEPDCGLERVVCALMSYSDSTHLASFGDAALWPVYLYFGNQSKYLRACPSSGSCHHIAYIPKLPDRFHDWYLDLTGEGPPAEVLTHCRRELMHAVWRVLLDDDFVHACRHGIVMKCPDGQLRRVYPRILTYSADYPEKALLATIRNLGKTPCPRCTMTKERIKELGTAHDIARCVNLARHDNHPLRATIKRARAAIYERGKGVKSTAVEDLLGENSYVPTINAFSDRIGEFVKTFYLFVVDLLHEIELGVWKALLIHLIRMLVAIGGTVIQSFNERFRLIPTFGRSTIRRIRNNVSAMKKIAARDFEDYLQCAIPVLEGLFPDRSHDRAIQDLIFILAEWHANAKLRLHTTTTVDILSKLTHSFGVRIRHFATHLSASYDTRELPKEEAARIRRRAKLTSKTPVRTPPTPTSVATSPPNKVKRFNLSTYKLHAMGDYANTITRFGTTDSYSTQAGELEHRSVKRYYGRTNKIEHTRQIARMYRRERILKRALEQRLQLREKRKETRRQQSLNDHHHIAESRNFALKLGPWLKSMSVDVAFKDFLTQLLNHLVARLLYPGMADDGTKYDAADHAKIMIVNGRIFNHKTMQVNYTTYDMRREYDIVNANKHADIMTVASDFDAETMTSSSGHPFSYARVIGIYHAEVVHILPGNQANVHTVQFLRVHWYRRDTTFKAGFQHRRLNRIELMSHDEPGAFGFIDPDDVIRGVHVIPAFHYGTKIGIETEDSGSINSASPLFTPWTYYYVNCFVDRDMYMRFRGGGVGHVKVDINDPIPEEANPLDSADNMEQATETETGNDNSTNVEGDGEDENELEEDEQGEDEEDDLEEEQDEAEELTYVSGDDIEGDDSEIVNLVNDTLGYADL